VFWDQVIHCDAGPNVCRAYLTTNDGAGYKAEIKDILYGARDNWFRPSDVCVAPDGSLFVADWYDPGVGGHNQQDVDRGRIFRVAPSGAKYAAPKLDLKTPAGCLAALESPNLAARYLAFSALVAMGDKAHEPLEDYIKKAENPRFKARALWALARLPGEAEEAIEIAIKDQNPDLRILGVRLAQELGLDAAKLAVLSKDPSPAVRRQLAVALRHCKSPAAAGIWSDLALQHDGQDRWYLEALGIGADGQWDSFLDAFLSKVSEPAKTPAGRAVIWRSRAKKTPELLVKIIKDPATKEDEQPKYFRAFDFLAGPEKEAALKSLLE
jgi:hypothetical protein